MVSYIKDHVSIAYDLYINASGVGKGEIGSLKSRWKLLEFFFQQKRLIKMNVHLHAIKVLICLLFFFLIRYAKKYKGRNWNYYLFN